MNCYIFVNNLHILIININKCTPKHNIHLFYVVLYINGY